MASLSRAPVAEAAIANIDRLHEDRNCEVEAGAREWEDENASRNCRASSQVDHMQAVENRQTGLPEYQHLHSDFAKRHIAWDDSDSAVFCPNPRWETLHCLESRAMEEVQVACNEAAKRSLENMAKSALSDAGWHKYKICSVQPSPARTKALRVEESSQDSLVKPRILSTCHSLLNSHMLLSCRAFECCFPNSLQDYKAVGNSAFALSLASTASVLEMTSAVEHSAKDCNQAKLVHCVQAGRRLKLAAAEGEPGGRHP